MIDLEPVHPFVRLRHVRFHDLDALTAAIGAIVADRAHDGEPVDFLDGTVFTADEAYLTLGSWADAGAVHLATTPAATSTTGRSSSARSTT